MSSSTALRDPRLIARLAPDQWTDDLLVEEAPNEEIAEARVGILLEPASACAVLGVGGKQRVAGIGLVEIGADHRRVADGEIAVDQHRECAAAG